MIIPFFLFNMSYAAQIHTAQMIKDHFSQVSERLTCLFEERVLPLDSYIKINDKLYNLLAAVQASEVKNKFGLDVSFLPTKLDSLGESLEQLCAAVSDVNLQDFLPLMKAIPLATLSEISDLVQQGVEHEDFFVVQGLGRIDVAQRALQGYKFYKQKEFVKAFNVLKGVLVRKEDTPHLATINFACTLDGQAKHEEWRSLIHEVVSVKLKGLFTGFPLPETDITQRYLEASLNFDQRILEAKNAPAGQTEGSINLAFLKLGLESGTLLSCQFGVDLAEMLYDYGELKAFGRI